jgi:hypothetical protein
MRLSDEKLFQKETVIMQLSAHFRSVKETLQLSLNLKQVAKEPAFRRLCWFTLFITAFVFVADVSSGIAKNEGLLSDETAAWFRISNDRAIGEIVGYCATLIASIIVLLMGVRLNSILHCALAIVLVYIMFDDFSEFHETIGYQLGQVFFGELRLAKQELYGQLIFGLVAGCAYLCIFVIGLLKSSPWQRALCLPIIVAIVMFGGFGVVFDYFHAWLAPQNKYISGLTSLIEDGGEMVSLLLLMLAAFAGYLCQSPHSPVRPRVTPSSQALAAN